MVGSWDTIVALAFAAEELVFAAQALTTDLVPREHGLGVAHRHLHELLQHQSYLPSEIGSRLRNLDALYAEWENSPATGAKRRPSVTLATMAVLSDVRDLLHVHRHSQPSRCASYMRTPYQSVKFGGLEAFAPEPALV